MNAPPPIAIRPPRKSAPPPRPARPASTSRVPRRTAQGRTARSSVGGRDSVGGPRSAPNPPEGSAGLRPPRLTPTRCARNVEGEAGRAEPQGVLGAPLPRRNRWGGGASEAPGPPSSGAQTLGRRARLRAHSPGGPGSARIGRGAGGAGAATGELGRRAGGVRPITSSTESSSTALPRASASSRAAPSRRAESHALSLSRGAVPYSRAGSEGRPGPARNGPPGRLAASAARSERAVDRRIGRSAATTRLLGGRGDR